MPPAFPPMPDHDRLRFEDGDLVVRVAEPEDAAAIFGIRSNPNVPFMLDSDRPASVMQLEANLLRLAERDAAHEPAQVVQWVIELSGRTVGWVYMRLEYRDKNGGRTGPGLATAVFGGIYLDPEAIGQGSGSRILQMVDVSIIDALTTQFGVEQVICWMDDDNEAALGMAAAAHFEGPLNRDHPAGLGFLRRRTTQ